MHHLHTGEEEEEESTPPGAKNILHCMHGPIACNNKRAPALINQTPMAPQDHDICVLESSQVTLLRPSPACIPAVPPMHTVHITACSTLIVSSLKSMRPEEQRLCKGIAHDKQLKDNIYYHLCTVTSK
jgi:hypothetical protein